MDKHTKKGRCNLCCVSVDVPVSLLSWKSASKMVTITTCRNLKNYKFWLASNDITFPSNFTKICSPVPHQNLFTRSPSKSVHPFLIKICSPVPHQNLFTRSPSKYVHPFPIKICSPVPHKKYVHPFPIKICSPIPHKNLFTHSPSKSVHPFPIKICSPLPHKNLFTRSP